MPMELKILAWSVVLGLVQVFTAGAPGTHQRGVTWNVGNRDGTPQPLSGAAARAGRNLLETFALFTAAAPPTVSGDGNWPSAALALGFPRDHCA